MNYKAEARRLRDNGYPIVTMADSSWLVEASRTFRCPGCADQLVLLLHESGQFAALHEAPHCAHFEEANDIQAVLGPANYAKLGEEWTQ